MTALERLALLRAEEQYESGSWRNVTPAENVFKPIRTPDKCMIAYCSRPSSRRGLCWMHYMRERRQSKSTRKYVRETT